MFTLAILQWLIYGVERETPFTYEWEDPTLYSVPLSGISDPAGYSSELSSHRLAIFEPLRA